MDSGEDALVNIVVGISHALFSFAPRRCRLSGEERPFAFFLARCLQMFHCLQTLFGLLRQSGNVRSCYGFQLVSISFGQIGLDDFYVDKLPKGLLIDVLELFLNFIKF